jgi:hypothetical protein
VLAARLGAGEKRQNDSRFGDVADPKFAFGELSGRKITSPKMNAANGLRARKPSGRPLWKKPTQETWQ